MNVIIPMAGGGTRFLNNGYSLPKPLIDVNGKSMIENVLENLSIDGNFVFIILKEHSEKYNLSNILKSLKENCKIVEIDKITDGAACTALLAKEYIDDSPLVIVNCDQMIHDFNMNSFLEFQRVTNSDCIIGGYISSHPKNSFMKLNDSGDVIELKEKEVISSYALNGFHFWNNGLDFVSSANEMIEANDRTNNEFYVAPTFNYLIKKGKKILPYFFNLHFSIGTPEDLTKYKKLYGYS